MSYKASAPGTLMLLGEYGVLYNHPALLCALNQRIYVTVTPSDDSLLSIESALGNIKIPLNEQSVPAAFEYCFACVKACKINTGLHISIDADFPPTLGLGSSAALVAALTRALSALQKTPADPHNLWTLGMKAIHHCSPQASGADLAASINGGVTYFLKEPWQLEKIADHLPLQIVYSGKKYQTVNAIKHYQEKRTLDFPLIQQREQEHHQLTLQAKQSIIEEDWVTLGKIFSTAHTHYHCINASTQTLDDLATWMEAQPGVWGAKLSGSGYGDCLIAAGQKKILNTTLAENGQMIDAQVTPEGTHCEHQ